MTIAELQILFDLNCGNEIAVLSKHASLSRYGYLFVDLEDGHCYLFDKNGKMDDIKKLKALNYTDVKLSIKKIVIPESVKNIGYGAFFYCSSLKSIEIQKSVESIGYEAFADCTSLEKIIFKDKTTNQVKAMKYYPWGIENEAIIKCS